VKCSLFEDLIYAIGLTPGGTYKEIDGREKNWGR